MTTQPIKRLSLIMFLLITSLTHAETQNWWNFFMGTTLGITTLGFGYISYSLHKQMNELKTENKSLQTKMDALETALKRQQSWSGLVSRIEECEKFQNRAYPQFNKEFYSFKLRIQDLETINDIKPTTSPQSMQVNPVTISTNAPTLINEWHENIKNRKTLKTLSDSQKPWSKQYGY